MNSPEPKRARFCAILIAGLVLAALTGPPGAQAAMAVVDASAIAKLTKQLTEMQKQLDAMLEMSKRLQVLICIQN